MIILHSKSSALFCSVVPEIFHAYLCLCVHFKVTSQVLTAWSQNKVDALPMKIQTAEGSRSQWELKVWFTQPSICTPVNTFLIFPSNDAVHPSKHSSQRAQLNFKQGLATASNTLPRTALLSRFHHWMLCSQPEHPLFTSPLICSPGRPSTFQPLKSQPLQPSVHMLLALKASPSAQHYKSHSSGVSCYRTGSDQKLNQISAPEHTGLSDQRYPIPSSPQQHLIVTGERSDFSLKHSHAGQGTQDGWQHKPYTLHS